jgi:hypothetical protein
LARGPSCNLSTATAHNRDSTLATTAIMSTPITTDPQPASGQRGSTRPLIGLSGRLTRGSSSVRAATVATATATNGAGNTEIFTSRGQISSTAIVITPTITAASW